MGCIGDKLLLSFNVSGNLVEQPVDCSGEVVEFVTSATVGQSVTESGWTELIGRVQDIGDRPCCP